MRTLTYYVAASLDGFIAGPDGQFDFFPFDDGLREVVVADYPETLPVHVRTVLGIADAPNRRFDSVVMGRATYQPALDAGIVSPYPHLDQHVVSTTLSADDDGPAVTADPVSTVRALKEQDGLGIWLAGGGRLAGSLADEIDELVIKRSPLLLGAGVPMFDGPFSPREFRATDSRRLEGGVTIGTYLRA